MTPQMVCIHLGLVVAVVCELCRGLVVALADALAAPSSTAAAPALGEQAPAVASAPLLYSPNPFTPRPVLISPARPARPPARLQSAPSAAASAARCSPCHRPSPRPRCARTTLCAAWAVRYSSPCWPLGCRVSCCRAGGPAGMGAARCRTPGEHLELVGGMLLH